MIVDPAVSYQYEWFCVLVRKWLGVSKEGSIQSCSARRCSVRPASQPSYTHPIVVTLTLACGDQGEATHVSHVRQMTMYGTERTINGKGTYLQCLFVEYALILWVLLHSAFTILSNMSYMSGIGYMKCSQRWRQPGSLSNTCHVITFELHSCHQQSANALTLTQCKRRSR